jgi:hypothetical protein
LSGGFAALPPRIEANCLALYDDLSVLPQAQRVTVLTRSEWFWEEAHFELDDGDVIFIFSNAKIFSDGQLNTFRVIGNSDKRRSRKMRYGRVKYVGGLQISSLYVENVQFGASYPDVIYYFNDWLCPVFRFAGRLRVEEYSSDVRSRESHGNGRTQGVAPTGNCEKSDGGAGRFHWGAALDDECPAGRRPIKRVARGREVRMEAPLRRHPAGLAGSARCREPAAF